MPSPNISFARFGNLVTVSPVTQRVPIPFDADTRATVQNKALQGLLILDEKYVVESALQTSLGPDAELFIFDQNGQRILHIRNRGFRTKEDIRGRAAITTPLEEFSRKYLGSRSEIDPDTFEKASQQIASELALSVKNILMKHLE